MKSLSYLCLLLPFLAFVGCGGPAMVDVSGTVKIDGGAPYKGTIRFESMDGGPSAEVPIIAGEYKAPVTPGKKKIRIFGYKKVGEHHVTGPDSPLVDDLELIVPAQYNDESTLEEEIVVGRKEPLHFDLKTK